MNDDFHEASFEVYYLSVRQKLVILGFLPKIFFALTLVTSETSWGQTMSFSDLSEVSNFSWRLQLLYEVLFVELEWKVKHPETPISQRTLLDHPCLLNWPKSPHRLGLNRKTFLLPCWPHLLQTNKSTKFTRVFIVLGLFNFGLSQLRHNRRYM